MILYACYFGNGKFEAMARALGASVKANAPECTAEIVRVPAPLRLDTFSSNTEKLAHWRKRVDALPNGKRLVLIDGDTLVLRPLERAFAAFKTPIAMTSKGDKVQRMRYNCGVVFVRGGAAAREFFAKWCEINNRFYENRPLHAPFEARHGGINQAAWGAMREHADPLCASVSDLPCDVWNACYPPLWTTASERAAVVHYKSDLRAAIWTRGIRYLDLVQTWQTYERISRGEK